MKNIIVAFLLIIILFIGGCVELKENLTNYSVEDVVKNMDKISSEKNNKS